MENRDRRASASRRWALISPTGDVVQALKLPSQTVVEDALSGSRAATESSGIRSDMLYKGSKLPRGIGDEPNEVVVDWAAGAGADAFASEMTGLSRSREAQTLLRIRPG